MVPRSGRPQTAWTAFVSSADRAWMTTDRGTGRAGALLRQLDAEVGDPFDDDTNELSHLRHDHRQVAGPVETVAREDRADVRDRVVASRNAAARSRTVAFRSCVGDLASIAARRISRLMDATASGFARR